MATTPTEICQLSELVDFATQDGNITGAQIVAVLPSGERFKIERAQMERSIEHPRGRLLLFLSDVVHYSCPVNGCAAWWGCS